MIAKFEVIENFYSDLPKINTGWKSNNRSFLAQNIIPQNEDLIYKRSNTMYLKILGSKYQAFLGNRYLLCQFPSEHSIHICTSFCSQFYHSHHLWLSDHSQNCCHKQLELLILSVQECMITSRIFRSQSFFQFLTQCKTKVEICWRTFCQIR